MRASPPPPPPHRPRVSVSAVSEPEEGRRSDNTHRANFNWLFADTKYLLDINNNKLEIVTFWGGTWALWTLWKCVNKCVATGQNNNKRKTHCCSSCFISRSSQKKPFLVSFVNLEKVIHTFILFPLGWINHEARFPNAADSYLCSSSEKKWLWNRCVCEALSGFIARKRIHVSAKGRSEFGLWALLYFSFCFLVQSDVTRQKISKIF